MNRPRRGSSAIRSTTHPCDGSLHRTRLSSELGPNGQRAAPQRRILLSKGIRFNMKGITFGHLQFRSNRSELIPGRASCQDNRIDWAVKPKKGRCALIHAMVPENRHTSLPLGHNKNIFWNVWSKDQQTGGAVSTSSLSSSHCGGSPSMTSDSLIESKALAIMSLTRLQASRVRQA